MELRVSGRVDCLGLSFQDSVFEVRDSAKGYKVLSN